MINKLRVRKNSIEAEASILEGFHHGWSGSTIFESIEAKIDSISLGRRGLSKDRFIWRFRFGFYGIGFIGRFDILRFIIIWRLRSFLWDFQRSIYCTNLRFDWVFQGGVRYMFSLWQKRQRSRDLCLDWRVVKINDIFCIVNGQRLILIPVKEGNTMEVTRWILDLEIQIFWNQFFNLDIKLIGNYDCTQGSFNKLAIIFRREDSQLITYQDTLEVSYKRIGFDSFTSHSRLNWLVKRNFSLIFSWFLRLTEKMVASGSDSGQLILTEMISLKGREMERKIKEFEFTLIGRFLNPALQNMDALLTFFPKVWRLEGKAVGLDVGAGRFQFSLTNEEDMKGVLHNGPYHFDGWMVSLVKWEPSLEPNYPTALSLWVKVLEVPLHLWEDHTFRIVGKALGQVEGVDLDTGSVRVKIDGYKPLVFQIGMPCDTGEVIHLGLEYDKMAQYCSKCLKMTHSSEFCPDLKEIKPMQEAKEQIGYAQERNKIGNQWEVPKKPSAKRALDYNPEDRYGSFPYKRDSGFDRQADNQVEKNGINRAGNHGREERTGGQHSKGDPENKMDSGSIRTSGKPNYARGSSAWPRPLYAKKKDQKNLVWSRENQREEKYNVTDKEKGIQRDVNKVHESGPSKEFENDLLQTVETNVTVGVEVDNKLEEGEVNFKDTGVVNLDNDDLLDEENVDLGGIDHTRSVAVQRSPGGTSGISRGEKKGEEKHLAKKGMVALPDPPARK